VRQQGVKKKKNCPRNPLEKVRDPPKNIAAVIEKAGTWGKPEFFWEKKFGVSLVFSDIGGILTVIDCCGDGRAVIQHTTLMVDIRVASKRRL
jgi:hypothetical protein